VKQEAEKYELMNYSSKETETQVYMSNVLYMHGLWDNAACFN